MRDWEAIVGAAKGLGPTEPDEAWVGTGIRDGEAGDGEGARKEAVDAAAAGERGMKEAWEVDWRREARLFVGVGWDAVDSRETGALIRLELAVVGVE